MTIKGNQGNLHEDVKLYFSDSEMLSKCAYKATTEKARGGVEKREYWQTDDVSWLPQRKDWAGLKSIIMTRNTIIKDDKTTTETRYFISSLAVDIDETIRAVRGHWMIESYHWHLDVTFHEDENRTIEKQAAFNLNIMRKLALSVLKIYDTGKKSVSLRLKRFSICTNPIKHLERILNL